MPSDQKIQHHPARLPRLLAFFLAATVCLLAGKEEQFPAAGNVPAQPDPIKSPADLPSGRLRDEIGTLSPAARERAMRIFRDKAFPAADLEHLHVATDGTPFYVCTGCDHEVAASDSSEGTGFAAALESVDAPIAFAASPVGPFPDRLKFHSKPGSSNIIYLNFAGGTVSGTTWNNAATWAPGPSVPIVVKPFNIPGEDPAEFSDLEQQRIFRIWMRVAEDYAPFDIDVTTERPSAAMFATNRAVHVIFSEQYDQNGNQVPNWDLGSGVATIGTFGGSEFNSFYNPCWVFTKSVFDRFLGDIASHEAGHTFGLSHDGPAFDGYYPGHGSGETQWVPIMGNVGMNRRITQWSKGEYLNANNTQDDLAIISALTGYRADDHANANAAATPLAITGGTAIHSSNPETDSANLFPQNKGIIGSNTDTDVFTFYTGAGTITLNIEPFRILADPAPTSKGTNLDVSVELRDSAGTLVASANPADDTISSITYTAAAGRYFLHVRGSGAGDPFASSPTGYTSYGSIGQYSISGSIVQPLLAPYPAWVELHYLTGSHALATADSDADGLAQLLEFAFGTDPRAGGDGPLAYFADGAVIHPGPPMIMDFSTGGGDAYRAVFARRKDQQSAGLTYTVQFSADLTHWNDSSDAPTVLTGSSNPADVEAVSIPYPDLVPVSGGSGKPAFFRVRVSMQ